MRSALTDAPVAQPALNAVNVFTTLLLRATQHATGLMVKVAPLLPSRDLFSSQRQLRWTHTGGLARWRGDEYIPQLFVLYPASVTGRRNTPGNSKNNELLVINLASVAGWTINQLPPHRQAVSVVCNTVQLLSL